MSDGSRRMFRYTIPVNGQPRVFDLAGDPVHVAGGAAPDEVDFWAEHADGAPERARWFQVFSTGHPLPRNARYIGTCPRTADGVVWHLHELISDEEASDE